MRRLLKSGLKLLVGCALLAVALGLHLINGGSDARVATPEDATAVRIQTLRVGRGAVQDRLAVKGTIYALDQAMISPKMPGKIAETLVDEGDEVEEGQVVARLEDTELKLALSRARHGLLQADAAVAQAKAAIAQAEASLENAETDHKRIEELYRKKAVSQQAFDHAATGKRVAEAALRQAREQQAAAEAQVAQARVMVELATTQLDDTNVLAPIAGTITMKLMYVGEMTSPSDPLFKVESMRAVELRADVSSLHLGKIRVGMPIRIEVDGVEEAVTAPISEVSPRVDEFTRMARVKARIENPDRTLRPGLFARAEIVLDARENVVVIPRDILETADEGTYVYRVVDGVAVRTPVVLGIEQGPLVEVLSGLDDGESVVTLGRTHLRGGERVDIAAEQLGAGSA